MSYQMKPLPCDPARLPRLSGKLIVSHYENNIRWQGVATRLAATVRK